LEKEAGPPSRLAGAGPQRVYGSAGRAARCPRAVLPALMLPYAGAKLNQAAG